MAPHPLPLDPIASPLVDEKDLKSAPRFPGGKAFVAAAIKGRVYIWGGWRFENLNWIPLPTSVIHVYDPEQRRWSQIRAKGEIPKYSIACASVVCIDVIFIFGGMNSSREKSNVLSTLSTSGEFTRVAVVGKSPSPRSSSVGWTFEGNVYFGFGWCEDSRPDGEEYIQGGEKAGGRTNQVVKFDRRKSEFSFFRTAGPQPEPRDSCAAATLKTKVYFHGGADKSGDPIRDFHVLDMPTKTWTRLETSLGLRYHSLSVVAPTQLVVIGGWKGGEDHSKEVWVYDIKEKTWSEDRPLPIAVCGEKGGLNEHRAVELWRGGRVARVICFGGETAWKTYSGHILDFRLSP